VRIYLTRSAGFVFSPAPGDDSGFFALCSARWRCAIVACGRRDDRAQMGRLFDGAPQLSFDTLRSGPAQAALAEACSSFIATCEYAAMCEGTIVGWSNREARICAAAFGALPGEGLAFRTLRDGLHDPSGDPGLDAERTVKNLLDLLTRNPRLAKPWVPGSSDDGLLLTSISRQTVSQRIVDQSVAAEAGVPLRHLH
jgi:hypothetical protein